MLEEELKRSENTKQIAINVIVLIIAFLLISITTRNASSSLDYHQQILEMAHQFSQIKYPEANSPQASQEFDSQIEKILEGTPEKLKLKKIESTKGLQTIIKLYQIGYRGTIDFVELNNRARGVLSYSDVISILLMKYPEEKTLLALQKNFLYLKYLSKHEKDIAQSAIDFCVMLSTHIPSDQQNVEQLRGIEKTLKSLSYQDYDRKKFKVIVRNIGSESEILSMAEEKIKSEFEEMKIIFGDNDEKINKFKSIVKGSNEFCQEESVLVLINAHDRLTSPNVFKIMNALYQEGINITTGRQVFSNDLSLPQFITNPYKHSYEIQKQILKSANGSRFSPIREHTFENLITFRKSLLKELLSLPPQKVMIESYLKNSVTKTENVSISELESPQINPDYFDLSFVYPLVEISGTHYWFVSDLFYEVGSYKNIQNTKIPVIEAQRQHKTIEKLRKSNAVRKPKAQ